MNQLDLKECKAIELSKSEIIEIDGGKPTAETSLAYDIVWCLTTALLALGKGAGSVKG